MADAIADDRGRLSMVGLRRFLWEMCGALFGYLIGAALIGVFLLLRSLS